MKMEEQNHEETAENNTSIGEIESTLISSLDVAAEKIEEDEIITPSRACMLGTLLCQGQHLGCLTEGDTEGIQKALKSASWQDLASELRKLSETAKGRMQENE